MMITDRRRAERPLLMLATEAAAAGLDDIQVREKDLDGGSLLSLVREIRDAVRPLGTRVLVNGRPDVALAAGAEGVQLPEEGLGVREVRRFFPTLLIGASRHSVEGVRSAADEGADFVVLGPVFATPGKEDRVLGPETLRAAADAVRVPVYAVGGVDLDTARRAVQAGAGGLAFLRPFLGGQPAETLRALRASLA